MAKRFANAQPVLSGPSPNSGGLIGRKYAAALAEAQDLLRGEAQAPAVQDSLDCGKLTRLFRYLRQGNYGPAPGAGIAEPVSK